MKEKRPNGFAAGVVDRMWSFGSLWDSGIRGFLGALGELDLV